MKALTLLFLALQAKSATLLNHSLAGSWVGTLEYRDYSDNSRQRLGTLLRISPSKTDNTLAFRYVYDDGPHKVVQDEEIVSVDEAQSVYIVKSTDGKETDRYSMSSTEPLSKEGYGKLILAGRATENGALVDIRETLTIRPTSLRILRESKLPGQAFLFRHEYIFLRTDAFKVR